MHAQCSKNEENIIDQLERWVIRVISVAITRYAEARRGVGGVGAAQDRGVRRRYFNGVMKNKGGV